MDEDLISLEELKGIIPIICERTFSKYFKIVIENENEFISKTEVAGKLKVNNLDEPFITITEASRVTGYSVSLISEYAQKRIIPSYRLNFSRGSAILFRKSELNIFEIIKIKYIPSIASNAKKLYEVEQLLENLIKSEPIKKSFSDIEIEVLFKYLFSNMTYDDISKEYSFTRERIRQIFEKTIRKIKSRLRNIEHYISLAYKQRIEYDVYRENEKLKALLKAYDAIVPEETKHKEGIIKNQHGQYIKLQDALLTEFELYLSSRCLLCLSWAKIKTVGDLLQCTQEDLLKIRNFGKKSLSEIMYFLDSTGLYLKKIS
jgi:hypothetical protein